jgi:hypothetical protein
MKTPYICVCCGYEAYHKPAMRKHLYDKIKPCPKILNDIDLTDDIKDYILANHVYRLPPPTLQPTITINQNINNNNTINNLIANIDSVEKLSKFMNHQKIELLSCDDTITNKFSNTVQQLENGVDDENLILDKHNLLEVIDQVSSLVDESFENLNIIYDQKFNKLKLYEDGEWNQFILISGIRTLLMKTQEVYFNPYECYLIRKIEYSNIGPFNKQVFREKLTDYYKFIASFDIAPYVKNKNDTEIKFNFMDEKHNAFLNHTDENREMPIRYMSMYCKIKDDLKQSHLNKIKKDVIDIVKKNSQKNIDELNKKVFALFNMDDEFKNSIL